MSDHYVYLLVNFGTLLFPLLFSFEKRVQYYRSWKYLFPALFITAVIFLMWDHYFTKLGYWGFNERYIMDYSWFGMPIEEILFFFIIPFSSIFIYSFLNKLWPDTSLFDKIQKPISYSILILATVMLIFNFDKPYTALNCCYAIVLILIQIFFLKGLYMGKFYRFYLWHLIPFFIVNGILTGTGLEEEVVWYDKAAILGIRMGTIPVEDALYSFSLMLMNISIFEYIKNKYESKNTGAKINSLKQNIHPDTGQRL